MKTLREEILRIIAAKEAMITECYEDLENVRSTIRGELRSIIASLERQVNDLQSALDRTEVKKGEE